MHKYLEMLPDAVDMPWQWSDEELEEMQVDGMKGMVIGFSPHPPSTPIPHPRGVPSCPPLL